jgi:hypothetical protein
MLRFRLFVLSVALLLFGIVYTAPHERAYAQTAPASPSSFGSTISNAVYSWATANGFSASDPRIAETLAGMGKAAAAAAATAAAAVGSAVADVPWVAVAAYAGVGAILGGIPVNLGTSDDLRWTFNPDGTVTVTKGDGTSSTSSPFPPLVSGSPSRGTISSDGSTITGGVWCGGGGLFSGCGGSPEAVAQAYVQSIGHPAGGVYDYVGKCVVQAGSYSASCDVWATDNPPRIVMQIGVTQSANNYAGPSCDSGMYDVKGAACVAYSANFLPPSPTPPSGPVSPQTAAQSLSTSDEAEVLNPVVAAGATNALWQRAAEQDGYDGIPYPVGNPVTPSMAGTAESDLGSSAPTVGGFASSPAGVGASSSGSGTGSVSSPIPTTGTTPQTGASTPAATTPGSGAQVNLGPDPGIGAPGLETVPTAAQILAPVLGLLSDLREWVVPTHESICPEPSFVLWGQTYTISAQCDLLNQYGTQITVACEVAFAVAAVLIVLTA